MLQLFDCVEIYPTMTCTMLYCYTVFSKILFFSWDLLSSHLQFPLPKCRNDAAKAQFIILNLSVLTKVDMTYCSMLLL